MSKIITVFGSTGNQGGSVIRAILADAKLSQEFKIRAVTRDTSKPAAKKLAELGCEVVSADLSTPSTLPAVLKNAHTVFLVTNYWELRSPSLELAQGRAVIDACITAQTTHFLFSSLINVTKTTQGKLAHTLHFDSKNDIEAYARSKQGQGRDGIEIVTFVYPGYFMSNFDNFVREDEEGGQGYSIAMPVSKGAVFPLIDIVRDFGKFTLPALHFPANYNNGIIYAAAGYYTLSDILSTFEKATGKPLHYTRIPSDVFKGFFPEFMGAEMLDNHLLLDEAEGAAGYYGGVKVEESVAAVEALGVKVTGLEEWLKCSKFVQK